MQLLTLGILLLLKMFGNFGLSVFLYFTVLSLGFITINYKTIGLFFLMCVCYTYGIIGLIYLVAIICALAFLIYLFMFDVSYNLNFWIHHSKPNYIKKCEIIYYYICNKFNLLISLVINFMRRNNSINEFGNHCEEIYDLVFSYIKPLFLIRSFLSFTKIPNSFTKTSKPHINNQNIDKSQCIPKTKLIDDYSVGNGYLSDDELDETIDNIIKSKYN